jgi:hypothetical protein
MNSGNIQHMFPWRLKHEFWSKISVFAENVQQKNSRHLLEQAARD